VPCSFATLRIGTADIDVAHVEGTESGAEMTHLADRGCCADGRLSERTSSAAAAPSSQAPPVNTGGGGLANGDPSGASSLRQVHESVVQLRRTAGTAGFPATRAFFRLS